jgi:BirA family biotin operon repressor/biotin-[acetyl-CoA-carboxylase] ligase
MRAAAPPCRWLADGSALALALGGGTGCRRQEAASLGSPDGELWRALDGPSTVDVSDRAQPEDFWSRIILLGSAPRSQFDAMGDLAAAGFVLPGPLAAVAGMSPRFHGFHGRTWQSAQGNLHLTVAIPLDDMDVGNSAALTVLPAVSLADAIEAATGGRVRPRIKWVTDLYEDGRKVAGVLTRTLVSGRRVDVVLHGIGVNVSHAPAIHPTPFVPAAGILRGVQLPALFQHVLPALARRFRELRSKGPAPLMAAYRGSSCIIGRRVRIYPEGQDDLAPVEAWPAPLAAGLVVGIAEDLRITIQGLDRPVGTGRLAFEEDCQKFHLPAR